MGTVTLDGGLLNTTNFDSTLGTVNHYNGTLKINGGSYSQSSTLLSVFGNAVGKNPLLDLSGAGTTSTIEAVVVGQTGNTQNGQLLIEAGRVLNNVEGTGGLHTTIGGTDVNKGYAYLGLNAGSSGTVTVTGAGSQWNNTNRIYVGFNGNGTLNINSGAKVSDTFGNIGFYNTSTSTATVNGVGTEWNNTNEVVVGRFGNGTLNVQAGAKVTDVYGTLGADAAATGTATVTGTGSEWNNSGVLFVGTAGTGTLNITAGGKVTAVDSGVGYETGSTGNATVTGAGSTWTNSAGLYIGGNPSAAGGTGTVSITSSGLVDVTGTTKLWNAGTLTIDGGTLSTTNFNRSVGTVNHYDGTLKVNGGSYTQAGTLLLVAGNAVGKNPLLELSGSGATSTIEAVLVGQTGNTQNGQLMIEAGRVLNNAGSGSLTTIGGLPVNKGYGYIGFDIDSTGTVTVTGAGSQWNNSNLLHVGLNGSGTLNTQNGGKVTANAIIAGYNPSGTGVITINGVGTQLNTVVITLGLGGNGSLNVQNGGVVSDSTFFLAYGFGATGSAQIIGSGSQLNISNAIYVGGSDTSAGGTGYLNITNGGVVNVTGLTKLWNAATITMNAGSIKTGSIEAANSTAKIQLTGSNNTLELTGGPSTFNGTVEGTGSLIKAGPGTLIFTAANTYAGGTTIAAGTLQVGPGGTVGTGPVINNASFNVARASLTTGAISGTGSTNVTVAGASLTANYLRQSGLTIGAGNTVTVASNGTDTGTSVVTTLSINATGKLDLTDNDLIVDNGNLATVTALLATGLDINGTYGGGPGITSSTFASNTNFNTVLGTAPNSELGYTSFSGQTVDNNDVLVKYTYFGDADLNGTVDGATDFDLYITGLTSGGSLGGWLYGDFDYSGTVDSSTDFDLYITGLSSQGAPLLTAGGRGGNLVQAVPEPSTLVTGSLSLLGLASLILRRRKKGGQAVSPLYLDF